jgi:hypothetical protein
MWWAPTGKVMQIFAGHAAGGCLGSGKAVFSAVKADQLRRFLWMLGARWQGLQSGICGGIWVGAGWCWHHFVLDEQSQSILVNHWSNNPTGLEFGGCRHWF